MRELVVFCDAYVQLENALYVITHNCDNHSITLVVPGNRDLLDLFKEVNHRLLQNSINIIYFPFYRGRLSEGSRINKALHLFPDIIKERRYLKRLFNEYFAELEGAEVYFFARDFTPYDYYFLKRLSKGNRLVYMYFASYIYELSKYTPASIIDWVNLIRLKLTYGSDISMGELPHRKGFAYMPDKFFRKAVNRVIDMEERTEMMKGFDWNKYNIFGADNCSVIYFDQPLVNNGRISDVNTYKRELNEIFAVLINHFKDEEIARKYHPNYSSDKTMLNIGRILPDFIPAEFFYNDKVKIYLSTSSCSISNVKKGLAVSIIDLITFKDEETREQLKDVLIKRSRSKILFPKSLDEFEKILISTKEQKHEDN